jgi:hypothetical protein
MPESSPRVPGPFGVRATGREAIPLTLAGFLLTLWGGFDRVSDEHLPKQDQPTGRSSPTCHGGRPAALQFRSAVHPEGPTGLLILISNITTSRARERQADRGHTLIPVSGHAHAACRGT